MYILKFLNRSGKMAISALQAVGLATAIGVGGIAIGSYISSSDTDNTSFPAYNNSDQVVYVGNANTGGYAGHLYYDGEKNNSSIQVSAKTVNRMDRQAQLEQAQAEMEEEYAQMQATAQESTAPQTPAGYQMGDSEGGLGLLSNAADPEALKNNPMGALSQSMGNIQGAIANAQAQAQAAAQGKEGKDGKAASLASATPNWASKAGGGSGGNGGANMSFTVQNSGKNAPKGGSGAVAGGAQMGDMSAIQAQAAQMLEGARIKGKSSFGDASGMGGYKNASVGQGRGLDQGGTDLEFARKTSVAVAKTKTRSANEAAKAFLASTTLSGGLMIASENFESGSGQGSKDFENDSQVNLRGIKTWAEDLDLTETEREKERNELKTWLWVSILAGVVAMIAIPFLKNIPVWGWYAALGLTLGVIALCVTASWKAGAYASHWGGEGLSTATGIIGLAMAAGVAASWFFADAFIKFYQTVWNFLGFGGGGTGTGGGGDVLAGDLPNFA